MPALCALEARLGQGIPEDHPSLPWLIRYALWPRKRLAVKDDGIISYERWKGKPVNGNEVGFCERPGSRGMGQVDQPMGVRNLVKDAGRE